MYLFVVTALMRCSVKPDESGHQERMRLRAQKPGELGHHEGKVASATDHRHDPSREPEFQPKFGTKTVLHSRF